MVTFTKQIFFKKKKKKNNPRFLVSHLSTAAIKLLNPDLYIVVSKVQSLGTTTYLVPVSLTHSGTQRHFSFWSEQLDLYFVHRNHFQPVINKRCNDYKR